MYKKILVWGVALVVLGLGLGAVGYFGADLFRTIARGVGPGVGGAAYRAATGRTDGNLATLSGRIDNLRNGTDDAIRVLENRKASLGGGRSDVETRPGPGPVGGNAGVPGPDFAAIGWALGAGAILGALLAVLVGSVAAFVHRRVHHPQAAATGPQPP